ncbi:MAG: hypothetical protein KTR32_39140 [Granulosicoccus sp.]|nr:hypothetical protein [Granulosicoccus sp.]
MSKTPEELTALMLRKELYLITTTPARAEGTQEMLPAHLEYQIKLEREGKLYGAGPFYKEGESKPSGGLIILRAQSYEEARSLADADPMHANKLRTYTVQKWLLNEGAMTFTVRLSDQSVVVAD